MSKEVSLQFQNIATWLKDARNTAEGSTQFFLAQTPDAIYTNPRTDISPFVDPLIHQNSDIVSFSEVFGIQQRDELKKKLETQGYTVYITDAFEMWSQSIQEEHLYNVVGIKEKEVWNPKIENRGFHNKRPIAGLVISLQYILSGSTWEATRWKIEQAIHLRKRLVSGILDGAISVFEFDTFTLATGHIHRYNSEVQDTLSKHAKKDKPFMLLWDMNVWHGKNVLLNRPFNTPDWSSFIHPEQRTFWFVDGLTLRDRFTLATAHMQPDVLIAKWVEPIDIRLIQSPSDHNGIFARVKISTSQSSR